MSPIRYDENGNPERRKAGSSSAGNRNANDTRRKSDRAGAVQENYQRQNEDDQTRRIIEVRARGRKKDPGDPPPPLDERESG